VRYLSEGTPEPPGRRQGHGESCGGELEAGGMSSRRIAFVSNSQVYVMNADGSDSDGLREMGRATSLLPGRPTGRGSRSSAGPDERNTVGATGAAKR